MLNVLTVDLEEWYHPEYVRNKTLPYKEKRIEHSLKITLDLVNRHNLRATFFVVGELAEKHPEIIESIKENNHEIAFHGYYHEPLWNLDADTLRTEIRNFDCLIREKCVGFRAPSFSLNNKTKWALKVLESAGYKYDSSIFPAKTPLYGLQAAPIRPYKPSYEDVTMENKNMQLWEFPLLTYQLGYLRVPVAGGFYLRLFPVSLLESAIKKMNKRGFPAVLFFHNWELDSETPRLNLGPYKSFITYYNLGETDKKLDFLLSNFEFTDFRSFIEEGIS